MLGAAAECLHAQVELLRAVQKLTAPAAWALHAAARLTYYAALGASDPRSIYSAWSMLLITTVGCVGGVSAAAVPHPAGPHAISGACDSVGDGAQG